MKKITLFIVSILLINACNSSKKVEKNISKGDYDTAIEITIKKLSKNKDKKKKQKYILLLEDAYSKAVEKDHDNIKRFEKDSNPAIIEQIYETYVSLDKRQELIKPILPLFISNENRNANFVFIDYSSSLIDAKTSLTEYLYSNALTLLDKNSINSSRKAYDDLTYLNKINPNYKDVSNLLEEAHFKGTNFVYVELENQTNQIIPSRLENDLLDFDTYGLDQFWTVYHSQKEKNINYNNRLSLLFKQIDVSPERISEINNKIEREIKDGYEYVLDSNGHIKKDSLGNSIKVDKYITVKADYYEIHQEKACRINALVVLFDENDNVIEEHPLDSEFIFAYDFAEFNGDKRALDGFQIELTEKRKIPFPTNEQIVFDTGQNLKGKFKDFIDDFDL